MVVIAALATGSLQTVKVQSWNVGGNAVTQDAAVGTTIAYGSPIPPPSAIRYRQAATMPSSVFMMPMEEY